MSEGEEIITPQHSAFSQLLRVGVSLLILMFMLLRGNIRCKPNTKIVQCFKSQLRKAQTMINEVCLIPYFIVITKKLLDCNEKNKMLR